jgi:hypothetical protein
LLVKLLYHFITSVNAKTSSTAIDG